MAKKTWTFEIDGQPHTVVLQHRLLPGRRVIQLDQQAQVEYRRWFDLGGSQALRLDKHRLELFILPVGPFFRYHLLLDGVDLVSGKPGPPQVMAPLRQGAIFSFFLFIFLGWIAGSNEVALYHQQLAVQDWPTVVGQVVQVETERHEEEQDDDRVYIYYFPIISFEYSLDGQLYSGRETDESIEYQNGKEALQAFPTGFRLNLNYNPADPSEAHLVQDRLQPGREPVVFLSYFSFCALSGALLLGAAFFVTRNYTP